MLCCSWTTYVGAAFLILLVMYRFSKIARFIVNWTTFTACTLFLCVVNVLLALVMSVKWGHVRDSRNTEIIGRVYSRAMHWFGLDIRVVSGIDHLRKEKCAVVVSNHQSILDLVPMLAVWPNKTASVAKRELFYVPLFGISAWVNGTIFINRQDGPGARAKLNATFREMITRNEKIWFYPEGTRKKRAGDMLPFKKGAFYMAIENQVPILPIVFSSFDDFYDWKNWKFERGCIRVAALPEISTEGLTKDDLPKLMSDTWKVMQEVLESLDNDTTKQVDIDEAKNGTHPHQE